MICQRSVAASQKHVMADCLGRRGLSSKLDFSQAFSPSFALQLDVSARKLVM